MKNYSEEDLLRIDYAVEGNTVRRLEESMPEGRPGEELRPRLLPKQRRRNRNFAYMLTLTAVTLLFGWLCFSYLQLHASINNSMNRINKLENRLAELRQDNLVLENRLDAQMDLDEVYQVATEKLGMVYPLDNERLVYQEQIREMVRQYDNIPTE